MSREIAILIDGGFLTKRLPKLVSEPDKLTPFKTVGLIRWMCRQHVKRLCGTDHKNWHRQVYRIFYYDAPPFSGNAHHPLTKKHLNFAKSDKAAFQNELFERLRKERNVALRLGHVAKLGGWTVHGERMGKLLGAKPLFEAMAQIQPLADGSFNVPAELAGQIQASAKHWNALEDWMVHLDLRQKGVDMRIGLDIASLALKRLADTIVLVAGDSDFVPAAKLARREGLQFILDPLWQSVSPDLFEHIDGLNTALKKPGEVLAEVVENNGDAG
jgi:uncharacterized LabA/DUF88 family protein